MKKSTLLIALLCLTAFASLEAQAVTSVTLAWNANVSTDNITKYTVYQATGAASTTFVKVADVTVGTTYVVANLTPGVYKFYVTASNVWGESVAGNTVTTPAPASPPTNLRLTIP